MKKRAWALALAFLLVLTGCGKKEEPVPDPEPPAAEEPIVTPEPEAEPEVAGVLLLPQAARDRAMTRARTSARIFFFICFLLLKIYSYKLPPVARGRLISA